MSAPTPPELPRVAVVEDDPDSAQLATASLASYYDVSAYTSGEAALAAFTEYTPVAVILDIGMREGMDGMQVLRTMRGIPALRDIPALALTAYASASMRERFLALGFDGYVAKPLHSPEQLLHAVQEMVARGR